MYGNKQHNQSGMTVMPVGMGMSRQAPKNTKSIIGIYGKDYTVLVGYKRMSATDTSKSVGLSENPVMGGGMGMNGILGMPGMGGMGMPMPAEAPEDDEMDLEETIINEHVLTKSYNENRYHGKTMYDGVSKLGEVPVIDIRGVVGVVADYKSDEQMLIKGMQEAVKNKIALTGPRNTTLYETTLMVAEKLASGARGGGYMTPQGMVVANPSMKTDAIIVDGTGEMYSLAGRSARKAGSYVVSPGVEKKIYNIWKAVGNERSDISLKKSNLMIVGQAQKALKDTITKKLSKVHADGSYDVGLDEMIMTSLEALQEVNASSSTSSPVIQDSEAGEIEVWYIKREPETMFGLEENFGKKLTVDEVKSYIAKLPKSVVMPASEPSKPKTPPKNGGGNGLDF